MTKLPTTTSRLQPRLRIRKTAGCLAALAVVWLAAQDTRSRAGLERALSAQSEPAATGVTSSPGTIEPAPPLREGAQLDEVRGEFKVAGDRLAFYPSDGSSRMIALENLNLERVARLIDEDPQSSVWSVSGIVTEYLGVNYLLVTRAVLKSASPQASVTIRRRKREHRMGSRLPGA